MNDIQQYIACNCTTCPATSCTCGCQKAASQAACACDPQCACGLQCQCGQACACPQS
jgi:hypothetical protein